MFALKEPIDEAIDCPATSAIETASTALIDEVNACPVNVKVAVPVTADKVPIDDVNACPDTSTS